MSVLAALGIGSAIAGLGASIYNTYSQKKENEIMREREDNAISRRMRDLEAAGLSPTLAAGSAASSQAGTAPHSDGSAFDFASKALSLMQGKADVSKTNADTALAQFQANSEKFKQAYMQAQTDGENLRNNWINADMFSKLNLRDKQGQKIGEEMKNIVQNTALLKAKTAYEQANTDFVRTQNDNALINRDMLMIDRQFRQSEIGSRIWNNYTSGNMLKTFLGSGGSLGSMVTDALRSIKNGVDNSSNWYYPLKVK